MSSTYEGKARHSGNSLVVTIPKPIAKGLGLNDGVKILVTIQKIDEEKQ